MIAVADAHVARLARLTFPAAAQLFPLFILRVRGSVHRAHLAATAAGRRRLRYGRGHGRNGIRHHRNEKEKCMHTSHYKVCTTDVSKKQASHEKTERTLAATQWSCVQNFLVVEPTGCGTSKRSCCWLRCCRARSWDSRKRSLSRLTAVAAALCVRCTRAALRNGGRTGSRYVVVPGVAANSATWLLVISTLIPEFCNLRRKQFCPMSRFYCCRVQCVCRA
jgi:hypothetical protein